VYNLQEDDKLAVISRNINENVPAKSIFLCGSRATGQRVGAFSDYDIGVLMSTIAVPLYLQKLKCLERELSIQLDINLAINPLPAFRLRHPNGNFFLYKLKREAVTLYGEDISKLLTALKIEDISTYWRFSYFFSALKEMLNNFSPDNINTLSQTELFERDAAKALLRCGEIFLLINGQYKSGSNDIIAELRKPKITGFEQEGFLEDLELAAMISGGVHRCPHEALAFWLRVRCYLLSTFHILMVTYQGDEDDIKKLALTYDISSRSLVLKNLQYFTMALLAKKKLFWRSLIAGGSIEKRVWLALLWLLLAVEEKGSVDRECLLRGYNLLAGFTVIHYSNDDIVLWGNLKESIMDYYPLACMVMGV